jgi:hypothetical protein
MYLESNELSQDLPSRVWWLGVQKCAIFSSERNKGKANKKKKVSSSQCEALVGRCVQESSSAALTTWMESTCQCCKV